jgi:hypothetical protein
MHTYRAKGIKDIIAEFPGVGSILEEYGIGCGPCTIGICQLKDILEIHRLAKEAEEELMLLHDGRRKTQCARATT